MQRSLATLPVILTGDRTTGPLHLGHYVGFVEEPHRPTDDAPAAPAAGGCPGTHGQRAQSWSGA